ncbi:Putative tyrosine-specific transport protein [Vibrio coralliirubri]|uniref:Tyrosine-specific transport protein n=2 Tax=Vibrionaceae TaxID=641 RepID=A0A1C3J8Q7_9VIBR|nr:Putative tyrosine-specific transport protein [Vibrio coralliirubri]CDT52464.1 Putative tyrosine-specific transport protein [Vibrio coralliirubri]CDT99461.1 Putative tyrosine-specific transport protein [Vibrio coralliirubri]SBT11529.1 Tyrosine-specific transport protein [Vibrio celticus]
MNMKLFGSSLILSGTALGAGMLAIPMVLAQFGFMISSVLMLLIFIGTTYSALLLAEACTKTKDNSGMSSVAYLTLGSKGKHFINALFYLLLVCMLIAYILGVGDIIHKLLLDVGVDVSASVAYTIFSLLMGAIVVSGKSYIDKLNRGLFILMVVMLFIVIASLFSNIRLDYLTQTSQYTANDVVQYSAVIFTSFASMVVIPSLVIYNREATQKQIRNMILLGSVIPLICYLTWLFAIIGNLGTDAISQFHNISELISAFSGQSAWLKVVIALFSALALVTSFLGVSMALYDQNKDAVTNNKALAYALTFILPLVLAELFASQFVSMLDYAGMVLVFLAIWGPLAMVVKVRRPDFPHLQTEGSYTAAGGDTALMATFGFGALIFVSWFMG